MRACFGPQIAICVIVFATASSVRGESWLRADQDAVRQYSRELGDKTRTVEERLESVRDLRILLSVYGAYNFDPTFDVLKTVRRETSAVGIAAAALFEDLQIASKRPDKRLPNPPVVLGPSDAAKIGIVR
jgi:hypothetical protein